MKLYKIYESWNDSDSIVLFGEIPSDKSLDDLWSAFVESLPMKLPPNPISTSGEGEIYKKICAYNKKVVKIEDKIGKRIPEAFIDFLMTNHGFTKPAYESFNLPIS